MNKWFNKIKSFYDGGVWTKNMVKNAVKKAKITSDEYELIIGEKYEP